MRVSMQRILGSKVDCPGILICQVQGQTLIRFDLIFHWNCVNENNNNELTSKVFGPVVKMVCYRKSVVFAKFIFANHEILNLKSEAAQEEILGNGRPPWHGRAAPGLFSRKTRIFQVLNISNSLRLLHFVQKSLAVVFLSSQPSTTSYEEIIFDLLGSEENQDYNHEFPATVERYPLTIRVFLEAKEMPKQNRVKNMFKSVEGRSSLAPSLVAQSSQAQASSSQPAKRRARDNGD
ncbi:hypothetical protein RND71_034391 [Anisodus tanguticus]|uniref:Uncharacterized protein n=1 Tax=Anisodus tanguticus TaxID=243964 RepID=A0AAE1UYC6_9SOLA|nr:hypothetical protein RND71_034391 [Anisodus tanguticus]